MFSALTLICLVSMVIPAAIGNIFAYPVSKKISCKISRYPFCGLLHDPDAPEKRNNAGPEDADPDVPRMGEAGRYQF